MLLPPPCGWSVSGGAFHNWETARRAVATAIAVLVTSVRRPLQTLAEAWVG